VTDESYIKASDYRTKQWVNKKHGSEPRQKERWSATVHVFGMIGKGYKKLLRLPSPGSGSGPRGGADSDDFIAILETEVENLRGKVLLLDGCRIHTSKKVTDWLTENGIGCVVDWPAQIQLRTGGLGSNEGLVLPSNFSSSQPLKIEKPSGKSA
jgi:hypothetical protein